MKSSILKRYPWALAMALLVLATSAGAKEITGRHHAGDRTGIHGMALFGKTQRYLAHIPTMERPHNEQLVLRVRLVSAQGGELAGDFSAGGHSIRPTEVLALDDLVVGAVDSFGANVFAGNFEHQAPLLHAGVRVEIEEVLVARNLADDDESAGDSFYLIGGEESWLLAAISGAGDRQEIFPVRVTGPAPGLSDSFALKVSLEQGEDGTLAVLPRAGVPGPQEPLAPTVIPLEVGPRIWCVEGPDFFEPCG